MTRLVALAKKNNLVLAPILIENMKSLFTAFSPMAQYHVCNRNYQYIYLYMQESMFGICR